MLKNKFESDYSSFLIENNVAFTFKINESFFDVGHIKTYNLIK